MACDVWYIPLKGEQTLIYAPFHGISVLANRAMARTVSRCLAEESEPDCEDAEFIETLRMPGKRPAPGKGLPDPVFLGLVPTRGCMMQCAYCDFVTDQKLPVMSFDMIRKAVDGYAEIMQNYPEKTWNIHFFGGEPFAAFREVVFAVNYARRKAAASGAGTHFEVTTNGYYSAEKAGWIAENIDTVVLSLDGFPETQNSHRPGPGGRESFPAVCRSADIFAKGSCELIIRSCVSSENAGKLPEWAASLADRWFPEAVCLEPMIESPLARKNGLLPPDPFVYSRKWAEAYRILSDAKIRLVHSSGDISRTKNSLCPLGQDAVIITPGGAVSGCWQLAENQQAGGIDLQFGFVDSEKLRIDQDKLEKLRQMVEENRNRCQGCFCYAHCAGGCVVNRERNGSFCRITKTLTLWQILEQIGLSTLGDELLSDKAYTEWLVSQKDLTKWDTEKFRKAEISQEADAVMAKQDDIPEQDVPELPPVTADPLRGWLRDGERIITAELPADHFTILEGKEALRFQLDHSGMNEADVMAVWSALSEELN